MATVGDPHRCLLQLVAMFLCLLVASCPSVRCLATSTNNNSSEIDRQALLCIRSHLSDPAGALDSWRNDSFYFCNWRGVSCSTSHTPRVVSLDLASLNLTGKISPCIGDIRFLNTIDMMSNQINGHIPSEIGQLTLLRSLNLSINSISGVIPDSISSCSHLQAIQLMNNSIEGKIPPSLSKLQFLQEITFSNNKLCGPIPDGIGLLPNLQFLFLTSNYLVGKIPETLGSSPLHMVAVGNNSLTGGIPLLLTNCSSLYVLDVRKNKLNGTIPLFLFNSTSLIHLDLSENEFSGSIPSSDIVSSQLQFVGLAGNNLSGDIPATLGNFSSLSILLLAQNKLQRSIPESIANIPSLKVLDLAYNNLSGIVPPKLYTVTSLTYLGLGVNNLVGRIPSDIGYTLPNIEALVMEGNLFEGPLPVSLVNASKLQTLALRDNALTGVVPSFWSLAYLIELDLGANQFEGVDWDSLSSTTTRSAQLQLIYLDHNKIQGILPTSIGTLPRSLEQLYLTYNQLTGHIPSEIGNLTNLKVLQLEGNLFTGGIPETLGNLQNLFILNLAGNRLSGEVSQSIGNYDGLSELYLQENNLSGSIPSTLAGYKTLVMINLSYNSLHGSIPPELFSISTLSKGLDLSHNKLTGSLSSNIGDLINLGFLDISQNQLSGEIPRTLGNCLLLESVRLEVNNFCGIIPSSFMSLRGLKEMDLSKNNLSGEIPKFFGTFSTLQYLNLSFNNLEGVVPTGGAFSNSSKVFLQGNKKLCANHPNLKLPNCITKPSKRMKKSNILLIAIPLTSVVVLIICVAMILFKKRSYPIKNSELSTKELKKFSYYDLAKATNKFSSANLVGSGRFGTVYIGTFKLEHPVAIKVFKLDQVGAPKNFFAECEVLRNTRHRNLIRVISLCLSTDLMGNEFKALILEYMGNGNLEVWLHSKIHKHKKVMPLNLGSRILVAMDIAAAVDYLHNWCTPPLVHCDLKPSNVLLDDDMVAHVSDFGLAKCLCIPSNSSARLNSSTNIVGPRGSVGYIAPEYGMGSQISTAGDVYSYGIILLEMLTGKYPTDDMFKNGLNLHNLVKTAFPHNISEILDSSLIPCYTDEEASHDSAHENQAMVGMSSCIKELACLGLKCSVDAPKDRPSMQDVYSEIIRIRERFSTLQS